MGVRKAKDLTFSRWEDILSQIIVGDSFGVDRIDYLLRDSHHTGVAYGKFDHYKLVDELRILPTLDGGTEVALGINQGGIYSAEALAARYYMFSQVYYHPIRLIYDRHLQDFLASWLAESTLFGEGVFPTEPERHLQITDDEVNAAMRIAASNARRAGHDAARRILTHSHFKVLYERNPQDAKVHFDPGGAIAKAAQSEFGSDHIRYSKPKLTSLVPDFPVSTRDHRIEAAISISEMLSKLQPTSIDYVFIHPDLKDKAKSWLDQNRGKILTAAQKQEDEDHERQPKNGAIDTARP